MKNIRQKLNKRSGFTLIETLVAILILTTSIVALTTVATRGVFSANLASNFNTASYLSQEGIELVRNIRDGNFNDNLGWLDGMRFCVNDPSQWCLISVDPGNVTNISVSSCPNATGNPQQDCPALNKHSTLGYYYYDNNHPDSIFTRAINLVEVGQNPDQEVRVTSTVFWQQGGSLESVTAETYMLNWDQ